MEEREKIVRKQLSLEKTAEDRIDYNNAFEIFPEENREPFQNFRTAENSAAPLMPVENSKSPSDKWKYVNEDLKDMREYLDYIKLFIFYTSDRSRVLNDLTSAEKLYKLVSDLVMANDGSYFLYKEQVKMTLVRLDEIKNGTTSSWFFKVFVKEKDHPTKITVFKSILKYIFFLLLFFSAIMALALYNLK